MRKTNFDPCSTGQQNRVELERRGPSGPSPDLDAASQQSGPGHALSSPAPREVEWGKIIRFQSAPLADYQPLYEVSSKLPYREAVCGLCEKTVSLALNIPLGCMRAATRSSADAALARQIAMYLCHTTFSLLLTEIGFHFRRDRTTVSYACAVVEDKRDDRRFDLMLTELESLLMEARNAMVLCRVEDFQDAEPGHRNSPGDCPAVKMASCVEHPLTNWRSSR